jgi:hypothetical protein
MSKSSLPKDAAEAAAKGRRRFVCRINQGAFQMSLNVELYGIAEVIEGIEASGWELTHVTWFEDRRDHPSAFCIFKRSAPPVPQQYAAAPQFVQQPYPAQPYPQQQPPAVPMHGQPPAPGPGPTSWGQPPRR